MKLKTKPVKFINESNLFKHATVKELEKLQESLDFLALSLADRTKKWTYEERRAYERGAAIIKRIQKRESFALYGGKRHGGKTKSI